MLIAIVALVARLVVLSVAVFWGLVTGAKLTLDIVKSPIGFFHVKKRKSPPDCMHDARYGAHKFANVNGVAIHYVEKGPAHAPLVLLLHGFPESWWSWRSQLVKLSDTFRVVAMDLRGYGESGKPKGVDNYMLDILIEDVHGLVKALGREKCVLVGHDWGGAIAWAVAGKHPEIIEKLLILNCPHPMAMRKRMFTSAKQFLMSWYMFFFQLPCLPELAWRAHDYKILEDIYRKGVRDSDRMTDEDIEVYKYMFSEGGFTPPINFYRAALSYNSFLEAGKKRSNRVTPKTLILWGIRDIALSVELAEASQKLCDDGEVRYFDATHWLQQDLPDDVNAAMREFIQKRA